jgi:two-component system, NarL family, invasion response regulator UvrY
MKLLIVDDHPIVRSALRRMLSTEPGAKILEAPDGESAVRVFRELKPDLVILDLNLPGLSGLEVMSQIRGEHPDARFLVISMYDTPFYVARVLEAGARGYVSKNARPEEIMEAVRRTAAGKTYIEHEIAQEVALWNVHEPSHPLKQLSPRDAEIMRLLAEGKSLTDIAGALGVSYKTVANQCSQLKAKLGMARTADVVRLAISYKLGGSDGRLSALPSLDSDQRP